MGKEQINFDYQIIQQLLSPSFEESESTQDTEDNLAVLITDLNFFEEADKPPRPGKFIWLF